MLNSFYEDHDGFTVECSEGRGYVSIDDGLDFHVERAENLGHELTFNPRALSDNVAHLLRGWPILASCVDTTFNDETLTIDFFIGENIEDETQLETCFNNAWGAVATILNALDPGSFGSGYLFDMPDMTAPKWGAELTDCAFCGEPIDYCLGGHDWIEEN